MAVARCPANYVPPAPLETSLAIEIYLTYRDTSDRWSGGIVDCDRLLSQFSKERNDRYNAYR